MRGTRMDFWLGVIQCNIRCRFWCRFGFGFCAMSCDSARNGIIIFHLESITCADRCDFGHGRALSVYKSLRIWRSNSWGFESPLSHQFIADSFGVGATQQGHHATSPPRRVI